MADLPAEMIEEVLWSNDCTQNSGSSEFAVFDGPFSPSQEELGPMMNSQILGCGDLTEMQPLDPSSVQPGSDMPLEMAVWEALGNNNWDNSNVTFAVLAEEEVPGGGVLTDDLSIPVLTAEELDISVIPEELDASMLTEEMLQIPLFDGDSAETSVVETESEDKEEEEEEEPVSPATPKKRSRSRRSPDEPPRKRGRKPIHPPGTRRRPRKVKLYEYESFNDPEAERKRVNALNAKFHRDRKKEEKKLLEEQLSAITRERDQLKQQLEIMRQREQQLIKELEVHQVQAKAPQPTKPITSSSATPRTTIATRRVRIPRRIISY